jgi:hypothetical protein
VLDRADGSASHNADPASLPISRELQARISAWQKVVDDYYLVMEAIPGGGWSYHTDEEFEAARRALNITFPDLRSDRLEGVALWHALQRELSGKGYKVSLDETLGVGLLQKIWHEK